MRIADVCAFYTPAGGGVRTYVDAKLRAAARFGHEVIVIAPGEREEVVQRGPGAFLVTIPQKWFADDTKGMSMSRCSGVNQVVAATDRIWEGRN